MVDLRLAFTKELAETRDDEASTKPPQTDGIRRSSSDLGALTSNTIAAKHIIDILNNRSIATRRA
jgi:hypothetical protein